MNTIAFRHSLRGRMLIYLVLPMVVISVAVIAFRTVNSLAVIREQAQRQLRNLAEQVALEVERGNTRAVLVAQMMAFAQEETLFGHRAQSSAFARRVLEQYPEFTGAYFGYEPDADHRDAEFAGTPEAASFGPAFDAKGRFIPYWFRDESENGRIKLEPLVNMETSLYYDGCRKQYQEAGRALPMVTEPYVYEGKMIVEQTYPIVMNGRFVGVAGVDRALSDIASFLDSIKHTRHADVILISNRGSFIASTLGLGLRTKNIQDTKYRDLLMPFFENRAERRFVLATDPKDGAPYYFATAPVPTGDWLVVLREAENHIVGPMRADALYTNSVAIGALMVIVGVAWWFTTSASRRIQHAMQAAERVASGDLTAALGDKDEFHDEIGSMFRSFNRVVKSYCQVSDVCTAIAAGDFSRRVTARSENDALAGAINQMAEARQQAEEAMRASEERFDLTVRGSGDGLWDHNPATGELWYADRFRELLGYSSEEEYPNVVESWSDGLHPDDRKATLDAFAAHLERDVPYDVEYRLKTKSGEYRWFRARGISLRDETGRSYRAAGSITDITDQKHAKAALATAEEQSRLLLESAGEGIFGVDLEGKVAFVNSAAARMVKYATDDLLGKPIHDLVHHSHADGTPYPTEGCPMRLAYADGTVHHMDDEVLWRKDGTSFPVDYTSTPIRRSNQVMGAVVTFRDITERKQAQAQLQKLSSAVEQCSSSVVITDVEGRIEYVNPKFTQVTGYTLEEAIGKNPRVLKSDEHPPEFYKDLWRTITSGREWHGEFCNRKKNGQRYWESASISPIRDVNGKPNYFVAVKEDITERKKTERALIEARHTAEAATKAKSDFLANMSHEIRTPMNGIIGMTDLTLDTDLTPEQRDYLNTVKTSADALLTLINDILDFSKIEAGKLELEPIDFALRDALADMLNTMANRAHSKGLELIYDVAADVHDSLIGDVYRLRQVIVNLVGNAIKFTNSGEIVLGVEQIGRTDQNLTLHFSVRDTGVGIPPDKLEAIFRPFEQADASTTRQFGGTGLGLAISVQLVELMQGRIWAESQEGQGSTFHFEAVFGVGKALSIAGRRGDLELLDSLPVLVVDDNATNRRILVAMLKNWRMRPQSVASGADALTTLDRAEHAGSPFQLVLSDVNMPQMDGFTLFESTRSNPKYQNVPFILLTSAARPGDVAHCREIGIAAHLIKPVKQSLLMNAIVNAVGGAKVGVSERSAENRPHITPSNNICLRILLAEDNAVNQKFAIRAIEKAGHKVVVANNGREAVEAWQHEHYEVVLMDVQMPEMDGFEATRTIRDKEKKLNPIPHTPIIAMTANAMKGDRERCLEAGMDGYVSKPVKRETLFTEIERVLENN